MRAERRRGERGVTYLEMVATAAIVMILASAILPLAKIARVRQKEIELRRSLGEIRNAIDRYHVASTEAGQIGGTDVKLGSEGYPPDLETLVKGVSQVGKLDHKLKFLRRIPVDPLTKGEWGQRCYEDEPDSQSWCGNDVWDVYTKSEGKGLDGTFYHDW